MVFPNYLWLIVALLIALIIIVIVFFVLKNKNKVKETIDLPFKLDDLLRALGGIENIKSVSSTISRITFKLNDNKLVQTEKIKELGASGIIETKDGFTFIFGQIARNLEWLIKNKL